ncbi:MAG: hypothetical protein JJ896_17375 [Rhodothermales bacterium]|nr:hypothetical protein [Rhodothermales bacterium]MBO6781433.1 hypothetical protein [Rhodothermales bacterium]
MLALTTQEKSIYPEPTLSEMMNLAVEFGILARVRRLNGRVRMEVLNEHYDVTEEEAGTLVKGLLLGYFYNQKRDDLSLARWEK